MNRHTTYDLRQMQSLPLKAKVIMTQQRIKEWYDHWNGEVYVSFSGGKDSTVLKHLVETTVGVYDVPSIFINTGLEFPEIQKFAKSQPNVTVIRPKMRFDEVLKKYGYPVVSKTVANAVEITGNKIAKGEELVDVRSRQLLGTYLYNGHKTRYDKSKWKFLLDADYKISDRCCLIMKKTPAHAYEKETHRKPFLATMASESIQREASWMKYGCNGFDMARPSSKPMSFWTEQDVLQYLLENNLEYCSVYGDIVKDSKGNLMTTGYNRTGCIFCMFGCHLDKEPNRFQRLQETHPRQYEYCIKGGEYVDGIWQPNKAGLGLGHVLDSLGVKYEKEPDLFDFTKEE